ncbi:MAG: sodium:proton antiporter [Phycisphaeraceae bacterium]|nr:sodium:proton antiporter [Phycisphaeraceae bacterium]
MTMVLAICVAVTFAVSIYLMLGRELKGVAMGVFLLSHAANLSILAMSGSPMMTHAQQEAEVAAENGSHAHIVDSPLMKDPPILASQYANEQPLATMVDPLPQALILTAIVISFGVMAFLLTLLVVTNRKTQTIEVADLAEEARKA